MAAPQMPRVYWDGQRFLVWNTRQAYELRCAHRIVGGTVGALPTNKRQTFEEALLAAEEGLAEVVDASALRGRAAAGAATDPAAPLPQSGWFGIAAESAEWAADEELAQLAPAQLRLVPGARPLHAQVYRALWARGFYITSGSGFGADYLAYPGDPLRHHAHLIVHVARPGRPMRAAELACAARLANSVKKTAVLAEAAEATDVRFTTVEAPTMPLPPSAWTHAGAVAGAGAVSASPAAAAAAATPIDAEARAEVALSAPLQGAPAVPQPRERTRRTRAPWEEGGARDKGPKAARGAATEGG
jgi:hypothetical protein